MPDRKRILVFEGSGGDHAIEACNPAWDVVRVRSMGEGLALLNSQKFDGVFVDAQEPGLWQRASSLLQTEYILEVLREGVAVVESDEHILWANATFEKWCGGECRGKTFFEALGCPQLPLGLSPFQPTTPGKVITIRLHCANHQHIELRVTPVRGADGNIQQYIALCRDVTAEVQRQIPYMGMNPGMSMPGMTAGPSGAPMPGPSNMANPPFPGPGAPGPLPPAFMTSQPGNPWAGIPSSSGEGPNKVAPPKAPPGFSSTSKDPGAAPRLPGAIPPMPPPFPAAPSAPPQTPLLPPPPATGARTSALPPPLNMPGFLTPAQGSMTGLPTMPIQDD